MEDWRNSLEPEQQRRVEQVETYVAHFGKITLESGVDHMRPMRTKRFNNARCLHPLPFT